MLNILLYCSFMWLFTMGVLIDSVEYRKSDPLMTVLCFLTAPITLPIYMGYRFSDGV